VRHPAAAEIEDPSLSGENGVVVGAESGYGRVVDVGYEARGAVERGVWGWVLAGEV